MKSPIAAAVIAVTLLSLPAPGVAAPLAEELGRSEVRVWSAPVPLAAGRTIQQMALPQRLERLGYERVHELPRRDGEYFWGRDVFWVFRRAHRFDGRDRPAALIGLALREGRVEGGLLADRTPVAAADHPDFWLEPELLAESLSGDRARRRPVDLDRLPEHVWRAALAAEDHRFFDHPGVDARAVARALVANLRHGEVAQGGSTITQQLIKNRDLTPRRTLGRKVSEAVRALALEAEHSKEEILAAYLDHVYLGHHDGLAVYGLGTAARAVFGKRASELDLAEAATLAGVIRSPNRLSPLRHPEAARERRDQVLARMEELGWASPGEVAAARARPVRARLAALGRPGAGEVIAWVSQMAAEEAGSRLDEGRGVVAETTLDPWLQAQAEAAARQGLADLRRRPGLRRAPVSVALVALDAATGDVLALVGGDPDGPPAGFDRARRARRQPGSLVKPFVLLEAFDDCGGRGPLPGGGTRVADEPVAVAMPGDRIWEPSNHDGRHRGVLTVRAALRDSRNVPFVRLARHCGFAATADRLREVGLPLPAEAPPSFVLGAVEASPLEVAQAYTVLANPGRLAEPRPVRRLEAPSGRRLHRELSLRSRTSSPAAAFIVADLLRAAAEEGTARVAALPGLSLAAKTGTSSGGRDAWLAGFADGVVTVVWVGRDDDGPLGLSGSAAAGPIFSRFMAAAVPARPPLAIAEPADVVWRWVDAETGLLVRRRNPRAVREPLRAAAQPRRDRFWRSDAPEEVIR